MGSRSLTTRRGKRGGTEMEGVGRVLGEEEGGGWEAVEWAE